MDEDDDDDFDYDLNLTEDYIDIHFDDKPSSFLTDAVSQPAGGKKTLRIRTDKVSESVLSSERWAGI